jgi:hypothetical protein
MVMVHAITVSRIEYNERAKSISHIMSQNPSLHTSIKILHVSWHLKSLKHGKTHGPLLLEVTTPEEANILMQEGLLHDGELKDCKIFIEDYTPTQCFKCQWYRHTVKTCKGKRNCGFCAKEHNTGSCPTH